MIQINEVEDKVTVPVIDFKFQNTGDATALMWQFEIEVLESKLDPTPALEFGFSACRIDDSWGYEESDKHLQIYATNHGYGPAENCEIILEEPSLNEIYSIQERSFKGSIGAGEKRTLIDLEPKNLLNFRKLISDRSSGYYDRRTSFEDVEFTRFVSGKPEHIIQKMPKQLLRINDLTINWNCLSSENRIVNGCSQAKYFFSDPHPYDLYLTELGFFLDIHWLIKLALPQV